MNATLFLDKKNLYKLMLFFPPLQKNYAKIDFDNICCSFITGGLSLDQLTYLESSSLFKQS